MVYDYKNNKCHNGYNQKMKIKHSLGYGEAIILHSLMHCWWECKKPLWITGSEKVHHIPTKWTIHSTLAIHPREKETKHMSI